MCAYVLLSALCFVVFTTYRLIPKLGFQGVWLDFIRIGTKNVEGRKGIPGVGKLAWLHKGVIALFTAPGKWPVLVKVVDVRHYDSLLEYIQNETVNGRSIAPHIGTHRQIEYAYLRLFNDEDHDMDDIDGWRVRGHQLVQKAGGMTAIQVRVLVG